MGNIYKGTIAGIEGNTARVLPSDAGGQTDRQDRDPVAPQRKHGQPHKRHAGGICRI